MYSDDRLSEEKLLKEQTAGEDDREIPNLRSIRRSKRHMYLLGFHLIFFLTSLSILLSSFFHQNFSQPCVYEDHMPMYSPALEAVRNTGHFQRFDGSFATPNAFKGTPSPAIDDAWANITYKTGIHMLL